jgi:hypothetical protein
MVVSIFRADRRFLQRLRPNRMHQKSCGGVSLRPAERSEGTVGETLQEGFEGCLIYT